jgi:antirestriction protein ArdC
MELVMNKVHKILTDKVLEMIEKNNVAPWKRPWCKLRPKNIRGTYYHGINYFILSLTSQINRWSNIWLTYNQIKEYGGKIKDGEKGTCAYFYKVIEKEDENGGKNTFPVFRYFLVFNLDQVDNITLKNNDNDNTKALPEPESIIKGYKGIPKICFGGDTACYNPVSDIIYMPYQSTFDSIEHYYSTLFHELAHSTGHVSRLNRKEVMDPVKYGSHQYSMEELVAELCSVYLSDRCGINNDSVFESSKNYLAEWYNVLKREPTMFAIAASRANKAALYILGETEQEDQE